MKLPKVLYAAWNEDSAYESDYFIQAVVNADALVEKGDAVRVGVYQLVGYADLKNDTAISVQMNRKK